MLIIPEELINVLEDAEFNVSLIGNAVLVQKYSSAGQDFNFYVEAETLRDLAKASYDYYARFDVSEEAYLWLDETGHGKNGAPYDMRDVYDDMEECQGFILAFSNYVLSYVIKNEPENISDSENEKQEDIENEILH